MGSRRAAHKCLGAAVVPPHEELLTAADLAELLRVSRRTISRLRARGALPKALELSANIIRWRASDIRAFLDELRSPVPRRR